MHDVLWLLTVYSTIFSQALTMSRYSWTGWPPYVRSLSLSSTLSIAAFWKSLS